MERVSSSEVARYELMQQFKNDSVRRVHLSATAINLRAASPIAAISVQIVNCVVVESLRSA